MLSSTDIQQTLNDGSLVITPYHEGLQQPASVDLEIAQDVREVVGCNKIIDASEPAPYTIAVPWPQRANLVIPPDALYLIRTEQFIELPLGIAAKVEGKSSLGRLGLAVHITAGFVDPGFRGTLTLEVKNLSPNYIRLRPLQRVAQICFFTLDSMPIAGYQGRYQGQQGVTEARPERSYNG